VPFFQQVDVLVDASLDLGAAELLALLFVPAEWLHESQLPAGFQRAGQVSRQVRADVQHDCIRWQP
jgi:hypothetical protein